MVAAERADGSGRRLVIAGAPNRDAKAVAASLAEAARVHALIDHPDVPKVVEHGHHRGAPFLELACDAVASAQTLASWVSESGVRLPYGQADAVFTQVRETMQVAHAVVDPMRGVPVCLGTLSLANVLFSRDGRMSLVGFGHNFPHTFESGQPDGTIATYQAPEVGLGVPPTPASDYVAVLLAVRGNTSFADLASLAARVLGRDGVAARSLELFALLKYFENRWIAEFPARRPSIEEGLRASERVRSLVGHPLDRVGLASRAASEIANHAVELEQEFEPPNGRVASDATVIVLSMAKDGSWIETPSGRRRLGRAHARMLVALVEAHAAREVVDVWRLVELAWPGEEVDAEAAANRVYVSLTRLRKLGLRDTIERAHGGWRIHPDAEIRLDRA